MSNREIDRRLDNSLRLYLNKIPKEYFLLRAKKKITFKEFLSDKMLIVKVIRRGVSFDLFTTIRDIAPFTVDDWADILSLSRKSLQRYQNQNSSFKSLQSEKIIQIAEVIKLGYDIFGDKVKFTLWLETPNFALGNLTPLELLKDSYGKELVLGELIRIDQGIFA